jgi:DNA-binding transcriptional LysR family regulator
VDAAEDAIRLARAAGEGVGGTVRVECAQSLTVALLAPVLTGWHLDRPDVTISFRESTNLEKSFARLESGETDLLLFADPGKTEFATTTVAEEEIVVALPAAHPLASRPAIRPRELQGQPFVHFTTENGLGSWIEDRLDDVDLRKSVVARTAVTTHAPQLAAAGLGVAVVPISAITAGFPGTIRPFEPRWRRRLVAMTAASRDPLTSRLVDDLRDAGLRVPADVAQQLVAAEQSATR